MIQVQLKLDLRPTQEKEPYPVKLFGQIIRTVVNVALVPVDVAKDVVMAPLDAMLATDKHLGERTAERIQKLKDEASE